MIMIRCNVESVFFNYKWYVYEEVFFDVFFVDVCVELFIFFFMWFKIVIFFMCFV